MHFREFKTAFKIEARYSNVLIFRFSIYFSNVMPKGISHQGSYICGAMRKEFTERELDRIIEMAWEDRTPFDAITFQFGISERETIEIMRK